MSKHALSPPPLPAAKRLRTLTGSSDSGGRSFSIDNFLSDELVLCIFSFLSWIDLCAVQATNRDWCRLSTDNELWRNLYLTVYGRSRLRGASGVVPTRSDGKETKPLPGGAKPTVFKDWKTMFRISSNWRRGRCAVERLNNNPSSSTKRPERPYQPHILLAGSFVITASSRPSEQPTIEIFSPSSTQQTLRCQRRDSTCQITALALDQSPTLSGHIRVAAFYSTGEFTIFSINTTHLSASSAKLTYCPNRGNLNNTSIVRAAYHHPLLVALSDKFNLFLYDLSDGSVRHSQTFTSFTSFPPTSLVLSTPTPTAYKLVLVYAIPVYPSHWSVGATELVISGAGISSTPTLLSLPSPPMKVLSTRTTRAIDIPQGWVDEQKLRAMRDQWHRKVSRVVDTQTDGKWIVLAPGDKLVPASFSATPSSTSHNLSNSSTTLQLYRLHLPANSTSIAASPPKLTFVRSLHGQIGPIASLALADGRCVSLGQNGSLWVWDLEAAIGAEVSVSASENAESNSTLVQGAVAFDDRKIITTETNSIVVRRFDV